MFDVFGLTLIELLIVDATGVRIVDFVGDSQDKIRVIYVVTIWIAEIFPLKSSCRTCHPVSHNSNFIIKSYYINTYTKENSRKYYIKHYLKKLITFIYLVYAGQNTSCVEVFRYTFLYLSLHSFVSNLYQVANTHCLLSLRCLIFYWNSISVRISCHHWITGTTH